MSLGHWSGVIRAGKKSGSDRPGQVDFAVGQVKIEVQWPGGHMKNDNIISLNSLASLNESVSSINETTSKLKTVRLVNH